MKRRAADHHIYAPDIQEMLRHQARKFRRGDVVMHADRQELRGIVTTGGLGITVAWEDGARSTGSGLLFLLRRVEPRKRIPVPAGALGDRGHQRQQAVTAALRRAGIEVKR